MSRMGYGHEVTQWHKSLTFNRSNGHQYSFRRLGKCYEALLERQRHLEDRRYELCLLFLRRWDRMLVGSNLQFAVGPPRCYFDWSILFFRQCFGFCIHKALGRSFLLPGVIGLGHGVEARNRAHICRRMQPGQSSRFVHGLLATLGCIRNLPWLYCFAPGPEPERRMALRIGFRVHSGCPLDGRHHVRTRVAAVSCKGEQI